MKRIIFGIFGICFGTGCFSYYDHGAPFAAIPKAPEGYGIVYVYRPKSAWGALSTISAAWEARDAKLASGAYAAFVLPIGIQHMKISIPVFGTVMVTQQSLGTAALSTAWWTVNPNEKAVVVDLDVRPDRPVFVRTEFDAYEKPPAVKVVNVEAGTDEIEDLRLGAGGRARFPVVKIEDASKSHGPMGAVEADTPKGTALDHGVTIASDSAGPKAVKAEDASRSLGLADATKVVMPKDTLPGRNVVVTLDSANPRIVLERIIVVNTASVQAVGQHGGTTSGGTETKEVVCAIPCGKPLDRSARYVINGAGVTRSSPFILPPSNDDRVKLRIKAGSVDAWVSGIVLAIVGCGATIGAGLPLLIPLPPPVYYADGTVPFLATTVGVGIAMVIGGISLTVLNGTTVTTDQGTSLARSRGGPSWIPGGFVF